MVHVLIYDEYRLENPPKCYEGLMSLNYSDSVIYSIDQSLCT